MKSSKRTIFLITFIYIIVSLWIGLWQYQGKVIENDVKDYYAYLPATYIYHDLTLNFKDNDPVFFSDKIWGFHLENGNYVLKMSMGLSMLYMPFFLLSHGVAMLTNYPADGFSVPYKIGLIVASLFYFILGLILIRKTLLSYYSDHIISAVLIILAFATNITNYTLRQPAMSHAFSFFLFAAFINLTHQWHTRASFKKSILLGLCLGLISLVRPTNSVIIIVFLLWNSGSFKQFANKIKIFFKHYKHIFIMMFFTILVWVPQFAYLKHVTGQCIYYTYQDEGFFFLNPKIFQVLFSFRSGWLLYTPVMIIAIVGMWRLYKTQKQLFWSISIFFTLNVYVISSWWCWWYGGSFGHRAFIDSYPLMAFPLAAIISKYVSVKTTRLLWIYFFIFLFSFHNLFQNWKFVTGSLHYDSMTKNAYFATICNLYPSEKYINSLITPDYDNALNGMPERPLEERNLNKHELLMKNNSNYKLLYYNNFDPFEKPDLIEDVFDFLSNEEYYSNGFSYKLNEVQLFRPAFEIPLSQLHQKGIKQIGMEYYLYLTHELPKKPLGVVMSFENEHEVFLYYYKEPDTHLRKLEQWQKHEFIVSLPSSETPFDVFKCYIWNFDGQSQGYIDDFAVFGLKTTK
jgi:hypothetical protein